MDDLRGYILSVVGSAVICGGLRAIFQKKDAVSTLIHSICGIYMVFVLFSPIKNLDFTVYTGYFTGFMEEAREAAGAGENSASLELRQRIIKETEAYILEKATSLGANVSVEVTLTESIPPKPSEIIVKGAVSPYVKRVLTDYIKEHLGIPEEAQTWMQSAA